jgi:acyl-CoA synthetase (AMP-forming)/AMP-acid ligase II
MTVATVNINIAARFSEMATRVPMQEALVTGEDTIAFAPLSCRVDRFARGLQTAGIGRGTRTVMMVPAGIDFFALVFALFKLGAVPVFIDPTMGFKHMGQVIAEAEPTAFIGIPKAHLARLVGGWGKATLQHLVTVNGPALFGGVSLDKVAIDEEPLEAAPTSADDLAAILFTSGSTGVPKGALHTHGSFAAQTDFVRDQFGVAPGEVHVATFPIFALFDLALGATAVLPPGNLTKPAKIDPSLVVRYVERTGATCMFGSPALLENLGRFGSRAGVMMPSLKAVISASGPVLPAVLERLDRMVSPATTIYVPYGATEGLPISLIGHREALELAPHWAAGEGLCIGKPLASVTLAIIPIQEGAIATWPEAGQVAPNQVGEIVVKGPIISRAYVGRPEANRLAKIHDPADGGIWHRMGDLGRVDEEGRLWFYGRKAHRVTTATGPLFTLATEAIFLQHPHVARAALVGVGAAGNQRPVMCIEIEKTALPGGHVGLKRELLGWAERHPHTQGIKDVLFHPKFPVDIRHNSKIYREKLAEWAAGHIQ